jgi:hypothetical protein
MEPVKFVPLTLWLFGGEDSAESLGSQDSISITMPSCKKDAKSFMPHWLANLAKLFQLRVWVFNEAWI